MNEYDDDFEPEMGYDRGESTGHSGTDTSREQATNRERAGRSQRWVLGELVARGNHGATVVELRRALPSLHHGSISSALTNLNNGGRIAMLAEKREKAHVYVFAKNIGDRPLAVRRESRSRTATSEQVEGAAIALMRSNLDGLPNWGIDLNDQTRDYWRGEARTALRGAGFEVE